MKICNLLRSFLCGVSLCCVLCACDDQQPIILGQDDARVAGFYCDYLILSGVAPGVGGVLQLVQLDSADLDTLLVRHYMTRESLNRMVLVYKRNPERWRAVLEQIQLNIRKKTVTGQ